MKTNHDSWLEAESKERDFKREQSLIVDFLLKGHRVRGFNLALLRYIGKECANWARKFGQREILEGAEVKALVDAIIKVRDVRRDFMEDVQTAGDLDNAIIDLIAVALVEFAQLKAKVESN